MKAKTITGTSPDEIRVGIAQSLEDGFRPTLAIVFISVKQDSKAVIEILQKEGIEVFGATSSGEFIDGDFSNGGIAVLLLDTNPAYFKILIGDYRDKQPEALAREMAAEAMRVFENPSIILSASIQITEATALLVGEPMLKAIESITGQDVIVWGGRAGDDFAFNETVVFTNQQSTKRGIIMLVFDGNKILVRGEAASGLKPVGTEKTITKAIDNWVYEIDHQPAAEMVLKYLGLSMTQEEAETFFPREGIMFSVSREKGDPVIRGVGLFNWKHKSFSVLGTIREGDKIRLTLPPDFETVEEMSLIAEKVNQEEIKGADALLMFSCIGRLGQFGPLVSDEIEGVRKAFKAPMAGFFTYGEFGRTKNGNNEFHNSTCCWVVLKEK